MTQPGAPDYAPQPQPHVPDIWPSTPPQPQAAQVWPAQPGPFPPRLQGQPPLAPQSDSTRTIAIIALVVSGLTLLGMVVMTIAPFLFFGALAFGAVSSFGDVIDEGSLMSSGTTYLGGKVSPAADGSVAGSTLAGAVVTLVSDDGLGGMEGRVTCDPVDRVGDEVSTLCRATDPTWYGIVRFSGSDGSFDVISMGGAEGPYGPYGPDGPMP